MTKTAANNAETLDASAFDAAKATDQFRVFAEHGLKQSSEIYEKMRSNTEFARKSMETTLENARQATGEMSLKSVSALRAGSELGFAHIEALMGARTLTDVMELQTAYLRKSAEFAMQQARDFQSTSTRATEEIVKPMRDAFEKSMRELEAA